MAAEASTGNTQIDKFLVLLKSAQKGAAAALIEEVLGAPGIYVFQHFLNHENVKALRGTSDKNDRVLNALELFAYGTYLEYDPSKLHPTLTEKQLNKLKKLSIVSEAERSSIKILHYNYLMRRYSIDNVRELEDFIIDCIYEGLINGKLNQRQQRLEILYSKGRDISSKDVTIMKNKLLSWLDTCNSIINNLDDRIKQANNSTDERIVAYQNAEEKISRTTDMLISEAAAATLATTQ